MKVLKNFVKKLKQTNVSRVIVFLIMLFYAITMICAVAWAVSASLKEHYELTLYNQNGLPKSWLFVNYKDAFTMLGGDGTGFFSKTGLFMMFVNSIWYSVGAALLGCMACAMTAYIFSKFNFKGKRLLYAIFIIAMLLPVYGNFPAKYKLTMELQMQNSPLFIIVNAAGYGNVMLIFIASFDVLSWEYAEAAEIDGANDYYIFFRIMFPLIKPSFIAIMLTSIIGAWNDYMTPLIYLPKMPTVAAGLYIFREDMQYESLPIYYAGVVLSFIPTLALFIVFRKTIMENVAAGGIKG